MDYDIAVRYLNRRMDLYRQGRLDFRDPEEDSNQRDMWINAPLPAPWSPRIFYPLHKEKRPVFHRIKKFSRERWQKHEARIRLVRSWFSVMPHTRFAFKRNLGAGGQGLTMQFQYTDPDVYPEGRDFVLKTSLNGWEDRCLRREEDWAMVRTPTGHAHPSGS